MKEAIAKLKNIMIGTLVAYVLSINKSFLQVQHHKHKKSIRKNPNKNIQASHPKEA